MKDQDLDLDREISNIERSPCRDLEKGLETIREDSMKATIENGIESMRDLHIGIIEGLTLLMTHTLLYTLRT